MSNLEFFKKQAKNLLKDWQTQTKTVEEDGLITYNYSTKFYDVGDLFFYYEFSDKDEQDIKLARAQHLIAQMVGFKKWTDLVAASEKELEYAEVLLRHFKNSEDIINWENTEMFSGIARFDIESKIEFAKKYFKGIRSDSPIDECSNIKPKILDGKEREAALRVGLVGFGTKKMNTIVKCIHCGDEYMYKDANAVLYPHDSEPFIMCKNYPKCDGSLMDMMSQEEDDEDIGQLYDSALTWTSEDD